ncbi:unnamed protein product [Closterium sp. NIES-53]
MVIAGAPEGSPVRAVVALVVSKKIPSDHVVASAVIKPPLRPDPPSVKVAAEVPVLLVPDPPAVGASPSAVNVPPAPARPASAPAVLAADLAAPALVLAAVPVDLPAVVAPVITVVLAAPTPVVDLYTAGGVTHHRRPGPGDSGGRCHPADADYATNAPDSTAVSQSATSPPVS